MGGGVCQARLLLPVAFDGHGAGLLCWCEGARVRGCERTAECAAAALRTMKLLEQQTGRDAGGAGVGQGRHLLSG